MGSQYIPPPEQNVVNVGDEISINALNGIAQANPAITSTNPVATDNSVATAVSGKANAVHTHVIGDVTSLQTTLDGKANLSGATFTGKIIGTATASTPAINVGIVTSTPTAPANGDIWIGTTLSFRNRDGADRSVPVLNSGNTFSATTTTIPVIQSIQGATSSQPSIEARHFGSGPAILISQRGTGDCIRIEDENPDTTPFVINSAGKVGIGVAPDATAALKVDANGIMFNDGTTQTTAQSGYLKAFVAFNGSLTPPTVTILGGQSSGVSSVVKNSTGNYTINFSSIFPNQYYVVSINGKRAGLNEPVFGYASSRSNSSVTIQVGVGSFSPVDADQVDVSIFSI